MIWKEKQSNKYIGMINKNEYGSNAKIIKYINSKDVIIEFQDDYKYTYHITCNKFKMGKFKNPYENRYYGVASQGNTSILNNGEFKDSYKCWINMIKRCHDNKLKNYQVYKNIKVCDEWLCFENFEKWYDENYYKLGNETMCLDKDLLVRDSKIYSPRNCIFLPNNINVMLSSGNSNTIDFPIGVGYDKDRKKYRVQIGINGAATFGGRFDKIEDAIQQYKILKSQYIKNTANTYRNQYENFPLKVFEALHKYADEVLHEN